MIFLGIDPGLTGAVAAISDSGAIVELRDTPTLVIKKANGTRHEYDVREMHNVLHNLIVLSHTEMFLALEESQAMPGQGVRSTFTTGMGFGVWLGIIASLAIPYTRTRAAVWKRRMDLSADKEDVRLRAMQHFPLADLHRKKDHGRAEALFLAAYARRIRETVPAEM